jgi:ketosteroid isomerase-like protein
MIKALRLMLLTLLSMVGGAVFAQSESTVTWLASSGDALNATIDVNSDITLTWQEASGDQAPMYSENEVCFFNKNKLIVAGTADGVKISQIVFKFGSRTQTPGMSCNVGSNSNDWANVTTTWTGDANSITFTASAKKYIKEIEVTYTGGTGGGTPVVKTPVLAITQAAVADTYDMDANGVFVVYYENTGNGSAENAKLTLFVDGAENATKTIGTLVPGSSYNNFWNAKYNVSAIEPGEHQVYLSLTADNAESVQTEAKTVTFTKKAPEATFSITAEKVTVPYDATSFDVKAVLTNTSNVDAADVKVQLRKSYSEIAAEQNVATLVGGASENVTLTVENGPFAAGTKDWYLYVNGRFLKSVEVTVEEAPVVEQPDLAITSISGTLKKADETSNVRVIIANNGNVDVNDAPITLTIGETVMNATVTVKNGQTGWADFAVATAGLTPGTVEATAAVQVEGDVNPADNTMTATLTVEEKPAPVATLALTAEPVEVEYGAENISIVVNVENTSEVDAANITLNVWNNGVIATETIAALAAGASENVTITFANPFTTAGTYEMQVLTSDNKYACYVKVTVKEAPVQVGITAFEAVKTEYNIKASDYVGAGFNVTLKNYDEVNAAKATLNLMKTGGEVLATKTVNLKAGEEVTTYITYTATEAGKIKFYAKVEESTHYQATWPAANAVEVTFTDAAEGVELQFTTVNPPTTVKMENGGYISASFKNAGTATAENVKLNLYVDDALNNTVEVGNMDANNHGFKSIAYDMTKIQAGEHQVYLSLTADNATEVKTEPVTVTFTQETPQATFAVTAENLEVAYNAENYEVVAKVSNTSEVEAEDVDVKLYNGATVLVTKTIHVLAAGATEEVRLMVTKDNFEAGKTYELQVMVANKVSTFVTVTIANAPVEETNDLAIESIAGTIDLANTSNNVTVTVKNNGTVDANNVKATLTFGETTLEKEIASIKAGEQGYAFFQVASEGISGETLAVTAAIDFADDNADNNTMSAELTVKAAPAAQPTFTLTADDVEVKAGEAATAVIKVTNTSEVNATAVEVKLIYGMMTVATQTVDIAAGETKDVTFTMTAEQVAAVLAQLGDKTSAEMQAQAGNSQCFFNVNVVKDVEPVYDMAITAVQGKIDLTQATNFVTVTVKNNGNQDLNDVRVTVDPKGEGNEGDLGETTVSVKAGVEKSFSVTLNAEGLVAGELPIEVKAWVDNDATATDNVMEATIEVVNSSNVEPAAEIAINPIQGWEVEAGEQTINLAVTVFNNGDADAENVTVDIYKNYPEILATATFDKVEKDGSAYQNVSFTYTFEQGKDVEFTAFTNFADANADNNTVKFTISCPAPMADMAILKMANVEATTEDDVVIAATVKNVSDIDAENVLVALYQGTEQVGTMKKINELAAGAEATVEFELGKMAAGTYNYTVHIASTDANADNNMQDVTVKVTEPVAQVIDMAITAVQGPAEIDLNGVNTYKVWYQNMGNVTVENADIILLIDGENEAGRQAVTVAPNEQGSVEFTLDMADFDETEDLGREVSLMGFVNVDGDTNADNNKSSLTATVVKKVAEPVITITAQPVEVEFGAEKFDVVATIVSDIDAENVDVQLFYNQTIATKTINLVEGEQQTVTFADVVNPFTKAGEYTMFIIAGKTQAEVAVTVKPEQVQQVVDLAISSISGTLSKDVENNYLTVFVANNGTADVQNAVVTLTNGENTLGESTVSVKAGQTGFCSITVASANLEVGEFTVVATVAAEGDVNADNNTMSRTFTIAAPQPELSFTATAQSEVDSDDCYVTVTVKCEKADAENIEVTIYNENGAKIDSDVIDAIAAGEEAEITIKVKHVAFAQTGLQKSNQLQVTVSGVSGAKWVKVNVVEKGTIVGIRDIMAQFGENASIYTLNGQKVNTIQKGGMYIVNGRKVMMK